MVTSRWSIYTCEYFLFIGLDKKQKRSNYFFSFPAAKLKHIEAKLASTQADRRLETAEDILKLIQAGEFAKDHNSIK